jgi:hypothetical protein
MFKSSTIGLSMSVSILDGSRRKSRMNAARIQLEQLNLNSQQQKEQASMELLKATGTLNNNREQYAVTAKNLELATKVFNSRRALYTEGVATLIELLDAERELSRSRSLHIQSQINVQTAWLDVHKANGTLLTEFLKSILKMKKKIIIITSSLLIVVSIGLVLASNKAKIDKAAAPVKDRVVIPVKVQQAQVDSFNTSFSINGTTSP